MADIQARIKSLKAQKFDKRQNVTEKQHAIYAETFKRSVNSSKTMVKKNPRFSRTFSSITQLKLDKEW